MPKRIALIPRIHHKSKHPIIGDEETQKTWKAGKSLKRKSELSKKGSAGLNLGESPTCYSGVKKTPLGRWRPRWSVAGKKQCYFQNIIG